MAELETVTVGETLPRRSTYPGIPIARMNKLANLAIRRLLASANCPLTREQEVILRQLADCDGISQVEIARRVGQDRNNLSRTLRLLENRGYIKRSPGGDRRECVVAITEAGRAIHAEAFAAMEAYREILFSGMSRQEIKRIALGLEQMTSNLSGFLETQPSPQQGAAKGSVSVR